MCIVICPYSQVLVWGHSFNGVTVRRVWVSFWEDHLFSEHLKSIKCLENHVYGEHLHKIFSPSNSCWDISGPKWWTDCVSTHISVSGALPLGRLKKAIKVQQKWSINYCWIINDGTDKDVLYHAHSDTCDTLLSPSFYKTVLQDAGLLDVCCICFFLV